MGEKELGGCNREENEAKREEEDGTLKFLEFVFNDVCFPPRCDNRMKIMTSPSDIKLPSALSDSRRFGFTFGLRTIGNAQDKAIIHKLMPRTLV